MSAMEVAIRAEGLSKRFGSVEVLAELDLDIGAGEVFGYLGPNGAGKTTTIRLLLGLLRPTSGRAEIFGLDVQLDAVAAHRRLAYVGGARRDHRPDGTRSSRTAVSRRISRSYDAGVR